MLIGLLYLQKAWYSWRYPQEPLFSASEGDWMKLDINQVRKNKTPQIICLISLKWEKRRKEVQTKIKEHRMLNCSDFLTRFPNVRILNKTVLCILCRQVQFFNPNSWNWSYGTSGLFSYWFHIERENLRQNKKFQEI